MSAHTHDEAHGRHEGPHATRKDYVVGFLLAAALTIVPFWLVMGGGAANATLTAVMVMALAAVQVVVHMVYFLHMNPRSEGGWTMLALLFTVLIVGIVLSGSLWVMHHLHANMTPPSPLEMRQMP